MMGGREGAEEVGKGEGKGDGGGRGGQYIEGERWERVRNKEKKEGRVGMK
jgi:hypothetical protein